MIKQLRDVNEFMRIMGQDIPTLPCIPPLQVQQLRYNLIEEENKELIDAVEDDSLVEIADTLCDLLYVTLGAFSAYGFSEELVEELFNEVQRSNMSKSCTTQEEAERTVDNLVFEDTLHSGEFDTEGDSVFDRYVIVQVEDRWVVNKVSDNKTQKSINYSKPNLKPILRKHGVNI